MVVLDDVTYYYNIRNNSIQSGTDRLKHIYNYWLAYMKILDVCFESGVYNNKKVYDYIYNRICLKYKEIFGIGTKQDLEWFYYQLRSHKYWNSNQLYGFTKSLQIVFFHFHRCLPRKIGSFYFRHFYAKFIK